MPAGLRRLLLLRHGKSAWGEPVVDHDRCLAPRGNRDVPRIAAYATEHGLLPRLILCSSARRAHQTAELFAETAGPSDIDIVYRPELYLASAQEILALVGTAPSEVTSVMVVGHNPGMGHLARQLGGAAFTHADFPTAALACLEYDASTWDDLQAAEARLTAFTTPRELHG